MIATDSAENYTYLLGRMTLDDRGITSADAGFLFAGQDNKAVRALLTGDADLLFIRVSTYRGLTPMTQQRMRIMSQSDGGIAFYLLCADPAIDCVAELPSILAAMEKTPRGLRVVGDLGIGHWREPSTAELARLRAPYDRYAHSS